MYFCLLLTKQEMRGGARERENVRDGVGLKIPAAELFSRNTQPDISCITNVHPGEEWAAHLELTRS